MMILRYLTCGCALKEDYVLAVNGYLGRRVTMAAYHQIQYVELKQNPLAMLLHLQKGRLHLLAGAGNQIHDLPYFSSKKIDFFRRRLLHSKEQRGYTNPINEKGRTSMIDIGVCTRKISTTSFETYGIYSGRKDALPEIIYRDHQSG